MVLDVMKLLGIEIFRKEIKMSAEEINQDALKEKLQGKSVVGAVFDDDGGRIEDIVMAGVSPEQMLLAGNIIIEMARHMLKSRWTQQEAQRMQNKMMMNQVTQNIIKGKR